MYTLNNQNIFYRSDLDLLRSVPFWPPGADPVSKKSTKLTRNSYKNPPKSGKTHMIIYQKFLLEKRDTFVDCS